MARIVYEDALVTEWNDGTEEVRFTDREWEIMLADPSFGYVCPRGHRQNDAHHGACLSCEGEAEAMSDYYEEGEAL